MTKDDSLNFQVIQCQCEIDPTATEGNPYVTNDKHLPLTSIQEGMLSSWIQDPTNGVDVEQMACILQEAIDTERLRSAWQETIDSHPSLRVSFQWNGNCPTQAVNPSTPIEWEEIDITEMSPDAQQEHIREWLQIDRSRGFDLGKPLLSRFTLFWLGESNYQLVWSFHHILIDGRAITEVLRRAFSFYDKEEVTQPDGSASFEVYTQWLQERDFISSSTFWKEQLRRISHPTPLVIDEIATSSEPMTHLQDECDLLLSDEQTSSLKQLAKNIGVTMNTLLQGAWALLLSRYSREEQVIFGATRACRHHPYLDTEKLVGLLINTVPVSTELPSEKTLTPWLQALRSQWVAQREHERTPLSLIRRQSQAPLSEPLFNHLLVYENEPYTAVLQREGKQWERRSFHLHELTSVPLTVAAFGGDRLHLHCAFLPNKFDRETIQRLLGHLRFLLQQFLDQPNAPLKNYSVATLSEREQLLNRAAATLADYPSLPSLHSWFSDTAKSHPDRVAITGNVASYTYTELDSYSDCVAAALRSNGIQPGDRVGLCMERDAPLVVALIGILKAGAAYVPIDLAYPNERLEFMLNDADVSVLLTQRSLKERLPTRNGIDLYFDDVHLSLETERFETPPEEPTQIAYIIYTSGSTGKPKGCMITHQNVIRLMQATDPWYGFGSEDVWTLFHSTAFDFSVWEIWGALLYGGSLVVVPWITSRSPEDFYELLCKERITVLNQTPSAFRQLIVAEPLVRERSPNLQALSLRYVIFGGEALEMRMLRPWFERHGDQSPVLVNMYGITETTVHVTYRPLTFADIDSPSVIGAPIPDLKLYILAENGDPCPIGIPGELHVGGPGLAVGYLNREELTAERFIPNPFEVSPSERLYRTGDLARYLPNGDIEYLGRIDQQVQLRGFRVELGEIESVLCDHPRVREAKVILRDERLLAYLIGDGPASTADLRAHLGRSLPDYMVPGGFAFLEQFPLTANGKLDLNSLPEPEVTRTPSSDPTTPSNEAEEKLTLIWKEVLRLNEIGVNDNFYELGGDSILAIQIISRARAAGFDLMPKDLFKNQTVAEFAKVCHPSDARPSKPIPASDDISLNNIPLTPIQHWFFDKEFEVPAHWNQSFLFCVRRKLDSEKLHQAFKRLVHHHAALRFRFTEGVQSICESETNELLQVLAGTRIDFLSAQSQFNLSTGPLLRAVYLPKANRLLITVHHLAIDGVSWRILLEDLEAAYRNEPLPACGSSFASWSHALQAYSNSPLLKSERAYWTSLLADAPNPSSLPKDADIKGENLESSAKRITLSLTQAETSGLLRDLPKKHRTQINDALLTALALAYQDRTGERSLFFDLEGHGRESIISDADLTRTIGWFTSIFPVSLNLPESDSLTATFISIKRQLSDIPAKGIGYGILRYLASDKIPKAPQSEILFNHLGQFDQITADLDWLRLDSEGVPCWHSPQNHRTHSIEINTLILHGKLEAQINFSENLHCETTVLAFGESFLNHLKDIIALSKESETAPLESFALSPMQRLFYTLGSSRPNYAFDQWHALLEGPLDVTLLQKAWRQVINRHAILRTSFTPDQRQIVHPEIDPHWTMLEGSADDIPRLLSEDKQRKNNLESPPLSRFTLLRLDRTHHFFLWSLPDLQMDGWSWPIIFSEISETYSALLEGSESSLPPATSFANYLEWLNQDDQEPSLNYWKDRLTGFNQPTPLPLDLNSTISSGRQRTENLVLPLEESAILKAGARKNRVTASVIVQCAWAILLGRCAGSSDIVFGTAVSGRPADLKDVESIVGPFTNNLPVRINLDPQKEVSELLAEVQNDLFDLDSHQFSSPLEIHDVSEVAWKDRLFDSLIVFQNYQVGEAGTRMGPNVTIKDFEGPIHTNYDLTLVAVPGEEFSLNLIFNENGCSLARAKQVLRDLASLITAIASRPEDRVEELGTLITLPPNSAEVKDRIQTAQGAPPRTDIERRIASVWQKAFGLSTIGVDNNFFDLGGHSLLLIRVHSKLCEALDEEISLVTLFQYPTIASLAAHLSDDNVPKPIITTTKSETKTAAIAIVGMALRVPGAQTIEEFWQNLVERREVISTFAKDEIAPNEAFDDPDYVPRRGVLKDFDFLDANFFGMSPKEAEVTDPQQRLFLELSHEVLEASGIDPRQWNGSIGVYGGVGQNYYYLNYIHPNQDLRDSVGIELVNQGNEKDYIAPRVAYKLNLTGPAINIHTACSTSLVAVCEAAKALINGDCDMAIAGGVVMRLPQERGYRYEEGSIYARDGHCRPFDSAASGTVFSNGGGLVALKRLEDAERDGHTIYAVIKGVGLNNDGANKVSFSAPSVDGQAGAIQKALLMAGFHPDSLSYIEAHGTGTPLGDPIELAGLKSAFASLGSKKVGFCGIGSLKASTGHLDAAAGVCGLIKTALSLFHKKIPATLHFEKPNPRLLIEDSPFRVIDQLTEWSTDSGTPRRAGVSALGVGGTNAHVVLEEFVDKTAPSVSQEIQLLPLSAKTEAALSQAQSQLACYLEQHPSVNLLADVAFTLQIGRESHPYRTVVDAATPGEAANVLRKGQPSRHQTAKDRSVAFLFPGQGAQYPGMGADLYSKNRVFRENVDRCSEVLLPILGTDLRDILYPQPGDEDYAREQLKETRFTQPALYVTSYALSKVWMSWGITPSAMLGHSVGEYVAATLAGVFTLDTGLTLVAKRAQLVQELPGGAMLAVRLSESAIEPHLSSGVDLAALNSPKLTVVAGTFETITELENRLQSEGIVAKRLATSHAFHSHMMEGAVKRFEALFDNIQLKSPEIPFVSNVSGKWITPEQAQDPTYWSSHLRNPVRFTDGLATLLTETDAVLLEVGAGSTTSTFARQHPSRTKERGVVRSISSPDVDENRALAEAVGKLWLEGVNVPWQKLHTTLPRRIPLPTYPFERQRYSALLPSAPVASSPLPAQKQGPPSEALPQVSRLERLIEEVRKLVHEISGVPLDDLDPTSSFLDLGFDSLFLTQASLIVRKHFGVKVTFRQLMENLGSISTLAVELDRLLPPDKFTPAPRVDEVASSSPTPTLEHAPQSLEERVLALERAILGKPSEAPQSLLARVSTAGIRVEQQHADPEKKVAFGPFRPLASSEKGSLTPSQSRHLRDLIIRYNTRTAGSKAHTQRYRDTLADPRAAAGFNPLWKDLIYPLVTNRSEGSTIWDLDDNPYVDVTLGFGLSLFGHRPPFVVEAIKAQVDLGFEIGPSHPLAGEVATMIREISGMDRVSFCNTGSEAVTAALRISRTVSGRQKIAMFTGAYHGIFDEVLSRPLVVNGELRTAPIAPGINKNAVQEIIVLEYGHPESLEILRRHGDEIAAVLVETVQSRRPDIQPIEFLRELRAITRNSGTALVFDEVVTGFRVAPGGNQERFGIQADIVTYGKVVGGGLPIGIVAGKKDYMDALDGGTWQYGDDSFPGVGVTFFAGTFVRHPLALAAAKAVLTHIKEQGPQLQSELDLRTENLVERLNAVAERAEAPIRVTRFSSFYFINFAEGVKHTALLFVHMRLRGIHIWEGRCSFISTAHSDEDLDQIVRAFSEGIEELQQTGFLPGTPTGTPLSEMLPLTPSQEELFLSAQMSPEAALAGNESITLEFRGALNSDTLKASLTDLIDRHEALRLRIRTDGSAQRIAERGTFELRVTDRSGGLSTKDAITEYQREEVDFAFDLTDGPVFRAHLIRSAEGRSYLILTAPHIVADGWSWGLIVNEIASLYCHHSGREGITLPNTDRFSDFVFAQEEFLSSPEFHETETYWKDRFQSPPPPLELPLDRWRPKVPKYRSGNAYRSWNPNLAKDLHAFCRERKTTPYTVLLACYQLLLYRLTGQTDLVIGTPFAGQPAFGMPKLVGHGVSFLPLRFNLDPEYKIGELLAQTGATVMESMEHQHYTLGQLLKVLPRQRDDLRPSFVSTTFSLEPETEPKDLGGVTMEVKITPSTHTSFPLSWFIAASASRIQVTAVYQSDLFDAATLERWLGHYETLVGNLVRTPSQSPISELSVLSDGEQNALLRDWSTADSEPLPTLGIHQLFEAQATREPNRIALRMKDSTLSYAELNRKADALANHLTQKGLLHGAFVGVLLERSFDVVISLLGILKCGAAYLPLDPRYPIERLRFILEDSGASIVLTRSSFSDRVGSIEVILLDESYDTEPSTLSGFASISVTGTGPAYLIYTSGSTGVPKGAVIPHQGVVRLVHQTNYASFAKEEVFLQSSPLSFDASTFEIWGPLLNGGSLALLLTDAPSLVDIGDAIRQHGVTTLFLTSGLFQVMVDEHLDALKPLRQLLSGGDVLSVPHLRRAFEGLPSTRLIHCYGPTESTTFTSCYTVTEADFARTVIPIGGPIAHTEMYILDAQLKPVPVGVHGELYIGGKGLALCYLNRPELNAERFIPHPFSQDPDEKLYRSGDICRWAPDGVVEFIGRRDQQVKIRGFRIEPGEIEAALLQNPSIRQCAVIAMGNTAGDKALVAYVVPTKTQHLTQGGVREHLQEHIPSYLIPSTIMFLEELPVTPNGKLDYRALPDPDAASEGIYEAPKDEVEIRLARLWEESLERQQIGRLDNFFDLGGHSLKGLRLFTRIQKEFAQSLPLSTLFQAPTIAELATHLKQDAQLSSNGSGPKFTPKPRNLALIQEEGSLPPVFFIHGGDGGTLFYRELTQQLTPTRRMYAIEAPSLIDREKLFQSDTIESTAASYLQLIRNEYPEGPCLVAGYSFGGLVAYEIAQQMKQDHQPVEKVILFDTGNPVEEARNRYNLKDRLVVNWKLRKDLPVKERLRGLSRRISEGSLSKIRHHREVEQARKSLHTEEDVSDEIRVVQVREVHAAMMEDYRPSPYEGDLILFRSSEESDVCFRDATLGWDGMVHGDLRVIPVSGGHLDIFQEPHLSSLASELDKVLESAENEKASGDKSPHRRDGF